MKRGLRFVPVLAVLLVALFLCGCVAGGSRFTLVEKAGFWAGVWHGMISFVSLIVAIFVDGVKVYELNNTGGWYDFGFLLGVVCVWGGHHATVRACRETLRKTGPSDGKQGA